MNTLIFSLVELQPILEHARNAPKTMLTMADRANESLAKPGAQPDQFGLYDSEDIDVSLLQPSFLLVKDEGVYIMSAGDPRQLIEEGSQRSLVAYAQGLHPGNAGWYDRAVAICGGDDFGERIEVQEIDDLVARMQSLLGKTPKSLVVTFISEDEMSLTVE